MCDTIEKKKLAWQCRRGILELDILLSHFLNLYYHQLSLSEKQLFVKLCFETDQFLWDLFFNENSVYSILSVDYQALILKIKRSLQ